MVFLGHLGYFVHSYCCKGCYQESQVKDVQFEIASQNPTTVAHNIGIPGLRGLPGLRLLLGLNALHYHTGCPQACLDFHMDFYGREHFIPLIF